MEMLKHKNKFHAVWELIFKPSNFKGRILNYTQKAISEAVGLNQKTLQKDFDAKIEIMCREHMRKGISKQPHQLKFMTAPVVGIDAKGWKPQVVEPWETREVESLRLSVASYEVSIDRIKERAAYELAKHLVDERYIFADYNRHGHEYEFKINVFS